MNGSLLGMFKFLLKDSEGVIPFTFENVFCVLGNSMLVITLSFFICQWICRILIDMEKGSRR